MSHQVLRPLSSPGQREGPGGRRHQGDRQEGQDRDQTCPAELRDGHRQQRPARPLPAPPGLQLLAEDRRDGEDIRPEETQTLRL